MFDTIVDAIKDKLGELSSWSGGAFVGTGVLILIGSPFLGMLAYGAIIYGVYLIIKSG